MKATFSITRTPIGARGCGKLVLKCERGQAAEDEEYRTCVWSKLELAGQAEEQEHACEEEQQSHDLAAQIERHPRAVNSCRDEQEQGKLEGCRPWGTKHRERVVGE